MDILDDMGVNKLKLNYSFNLMHVPSVYANPISIFNTLHN